MPTTMPARICSTCMAFVGRALPADPEDRKRKLAGLAAAGIDVLLGRCHLNPLTVEKHEGDFCLQHRPKSGSKKP
jgi:hypothetical protein